MSKQPWRYRCPRGHTNWRVISTEKDSCSTYWCETCHIDGLEPGFDEFKDLKSTASD